LIVTCLVLVANLSPGSENSEGGFGAAVFKAADGGALPYRLFAPAQPIGGRYPLVLFLHGFEALGNDNKKQISGMDGTGSRVWTSSANQSRHPCLVLAPQCPRGALWANPFTRNPTVQLRRVMELLREIQTHYPVDAERIYVTGQSMGGFGTWALLTEYPGYFAAGIPVCGGGSTKSAGLLADTAIWAFHGSADPVVPVHESRRMVAAIRKAGGSPRYTEYPHKMHKIWNKAYFEPGLVTWTFRQSRGRVSD
jgi:predicted peptidase